MNNRHTYNYGYTEGTEGTEGTDIASLVKALN
jgi:hypothetical protein